MPRLAMAFKPRPMLPALCDCCGVDLTDEETGALIVFDTESHPDPGQLDFDGGPGDETRIWVTPLGGIGTGRHHRR